jgi:transcriptional regulator with XRE-family HTH domain
MARKRERPGLVEQLRIAIRTSGQSLYRIAKNTGVGADRLSRFLRGQRTLTLPAAEKICDVLGLELTKARKKPPASGGAEGK